MPESVVVDTSTLIALEKIGMLDILCKIYKKVILPEAVAAEFGPALLDCSTTTKVESRIVKLLTDDLNLGKGESEVIAFALASDMTAIIDDEKARKTAKTLGLTVTGTIGILLKAEELGLIESAHVKAQELKFIVSLFGCLTKRLCTFNIAVPFYRSQPLWKLPKIN